MDRIRKIHLVAACGTGMGTLACMLKQMGYEVTGSDQHVYPPMSDFLAASDIHLFNGFDPAHLDHSPDLVIIGNAVTRDNPEASAVLDRQIPYLSMPQAVNRFVAADKKIILVTGTHGKTTTAAMMAHILMKAGLDPGFMIGGILKDYQSGFRIGNGEYLVIEGDEYDTAFFDKGPKFMHYDPFITIMTGVEFDHADIFRDLDHVKSVFAKLAAKVADTRCVIACKDSPHLMDILADLSAEPIFYGTGGDWTYADLVQADHRTRARIRGPESDYEIETRLPGHHNLMNFLACAAAAHTSGIPTDTVKQAMASFSGVRRRQDVRGVKHGITVMDDFAHHPSAVAATIRAVKPFYHPGRVIAVFEPRTNTSMRRFFQDTYPAAFTDADMVCICNPAVKKTIPENERFSPEKLVSDINALGVEAHHFPDTTGLLSFLPSRLISRDLVLIMSNGGFDNIHTRLLDTIQRSIKERHMTQNDLKVEWHAGFSVDVAEIDTHQKKMFDLFNELIDLKQNKAEPKAIANVITEINDYGKLYFATEEKILKKREYPDRDIHARYHRRFVRNALTLRREITEDVNNLSLEAIVSLRDWLIEHIQTYDSMYVPFLRIHRYVEGVSKKQ